MPAANPLDAANSSQSLTIVLSESLITGSRPLLCCVDSIALSCLVYSISSKDFERLIVVRRTPDIAIISEYVNFFILIKSTDLRRLST